MYPNNNNKNNKRIKTKKKKEVKTEEGEREERGFFFLFLSSLLFKIYGNQIVGFHRSKRQSRSTYRELRVGTKILVFRQTPRSIEFSYLCYFYHKGH